MLAPKKQLQQKWRAQDDGAYTTTSALLSPSAAQRRALRFSHKINKAANARILRLGVRPQTHKNEKHPWSAFFTFPGVGFLVPFEAHHLLRGKLFQSLGQGLQVFHLENKGKTKSAQSVF